MNEDVQAAIGQFMVLLVRGVTLRQPSHVALHQHGVSLYVRAALPPQGPELEATRADLVFSPCEGLTVSPATGFEVTDFGEDWPPHERIRQIENRIQIASAADARKLVSIKGGRH
jgi:hypothetical protein